MIASNSTFIPRPRLDRLAACLALALAVGQSEAQTLVERPLPATASATPGFVRTTYQPATQRYNSVSTNPPLEVTSCADNGAAGTLRYEIFHAADGDTVDMNNLPCSTITLANGAIAIGQDNLSVVASASHPITIDAHGASRVFEEDRYSLGTLSLQNLELANGYGGSGGCVYLRYGAVTLSSTILTGCHATARGGAIDTQTLHAYNSTISNNVVSGQQVHGGGIHANSVYLRDSSVNGNQALSAVNDSNAFAYGGGIEGPELRLVRSIVAGNLAQASHGPARGGGLMALFGADISYSTISGNRAVSSGSAGGGVYAAGTSTISYSTIDHNQSVNNSALVVTGSGSTVSVRNSTISTNTATTGSSAIFASIPLTISNSTIAFNVAAGTTAGIYLYPGGNVDLESTIIASNTSTAGGGYDLVSRASVSGSHNLIQNPGSTVPLGVAIVGVDPRLAPLENNGGQSRTNALQAGSPAIDAGSNSQFLPFDQRGTGFGRVIGTAADIGAYEWDPDRIFANGFQ
jgi:hypothetical protein